MIGRGPFGVLAAAALATALASCGERPDAGGASRLSAVVRDSAGILIVENRGRPDETALGWTVEAEPALVIGGDAPGAELYQLMSAFRTRDGRIVAANAGTGRVHVYSAAGELVRSVGGSGRGPGEFGALFWVGPLPGDSIAAWDAALSRLTVFEPDGDLARVVTPEAPLGLFPQARGVLPDGRVVVSAGGGPVGGVTADPQVRRDTVAYVVLGRGGEVSDTLGRFPGPEMLYMAPPSMGMLIRPLPFGRQTVSAVQEGRVVVGTGDRFELAAYEPGGGLRAIVRADYSPLAVTRVEITAYRERLVTLGREGDANFIRQQEMLLDRAPYPRTMPAYTDLVQDSEGNLWVQEPARPQADGPDRWTVFGADGRIRGTVRVPRGLRVFQIGADWVLGAMLDGDQLEHLQLHRIWK